MSSECEQLLGRLRLRANQSSDEDLRQAVALVLDARERLAEMASVLGQVQRSNNKLRGKLRKLGER